MADNNLEIMLDRMAKGLKYHLARIPQIKWKNYATTRTEDFGSKYPAIRVVKLRDNRSQPLIRGGRHDVIYEITVFARGRTSQIAEDKTNKIATLVLAKLEANRHLLIAGVPGCQDSWEVSTDYAKPLENSEQEYFATITYQLWDMVRIVRET